MTTFLRRCPPWLGSCLGLVGLSAAVLAVAPAIPATAAPARPDLTIDVTASPDHLGLDGGVVHVAIDVRNIGTGGTNDVTVKIRPPAGADLAGDATSTWQCDYTTWRCRFAGLAAGTAAETLRVPFRLPPGDAGDSVTVSATVSTSTLEPATGNNTDKATVIYTSVADLDLDMQVSSTEISNLGDRGFLSVVVRNIGTAPTQDASFTIEPPAGAWLETEYFEPWEWECDLSATPWTCEREGLGIDEVGVIHFTVRYPPGTTGDTVTVRGDASTTSPESSYANNTREIALNYIVPAPADIALTGINVYPREVKAGDTVDLWVEAQNIGGTPASDVTIRWPLPSTVTPVAEETTSTGWDCALGQNAETGGQYWDCVHPLFEPNELVPPLELKARVGAGTPGGPLTFTATARTTTPEASTENNSLDTTTNYVPEGRIIGHVWLDEDRDGQRDADEPGLGSGSEGVGRLLFLEEGTQPTWNTPMATVNPTGEYWQPLPPGRYFVRLEPGIGSDLTFTTPDVGDDATDSDILPTGVNAYYPYGDSAVVEVRDGADTVIDAGLVPLSGT